MMYAATSVRVDVNEDHICFRFFNERWEDDRIVEEVEGVSVMIPKTHRNEIAIYTGDDREPYDYTEWFHARKPLG